MPFPSDILFPLETIFPGDEDVVVPPEEGPAADARISWSEPSKRIFETGLDRGVLYPKTGLPVAWNGLTAVDEDGAESATAFYIDGRPYIFLPTPKEFTATLKAFTYPNEFATLMGVKEIVDGMYLDSQQSDSFDLSYRTLIGSGVDGNTVGYKIHLLYNVTVSPQGSSYETLSDSINPSEFSWQIQAVPVPISGHRATAHIVIDTRHLDKVRLEGVETLLYGDDLNFPSMPSPEVLVELLSFGDAIIVTDNGNETWTVEGSYLNVYLTAPGYFQIDNITAVDTGGGTYEISSTP